MKIEEGIKKYIEANGLKQKYVAELSGITENSISRILCGKRRMRAEELLNMCRAFDIDPRTLTDESDTV